jgi:hypothetical protein
VENRQRILATKKVVNKNPEQGQQVNHSESSMIPVIDPRYRRLTCYNCGELGHFVGIGDKPKVCFMCAIHGHYMNHCPLWKMEQPVATYIGSAGSGLGFYHLELPQLESTKWLNIKNCGMVVIRKGEISM